jgi:hypothetical protein
VTATSAFGTGRAVADALGHFRSARYAYQAICVAGMLAAGASLVNTLSCETVVE